MFLALTEMRRAPARFSLLTGAVGLLIFLILFQQTLLGALIGDFIGALERQTGEVVVLDSQARRNVEGSALPPSVVDEVAQVPGVAEAGPVGQALFTVRADGELTDANLWGWSPGRPGGPSELDAGRLPEGPGEAVASSADAPDGFGVGDQVTLAAGELSLEIVGTVPQARFSVAPTLFVPLDAYTQARQAQNPDAEVVFISLVAVTPEAGVSAEDLTGVIESNLDGVEALTRSQAVDENPGVQGVSQSFAVILLLAFVVVVLVIGFFFLILTVQKAGSLTLLRAIGAPSGVLVRSLLIQVALVTVGGALVAVALTVALVEGQVFGSGLDASVSVSTTLATVVGLVVLALAASLASVRRVLRIDPYTATISGSRA